MTTGAPDSTATTDGTHASEESEESKRRRPSGIRRILVWVGVAVGVLVIAVGAIVWWDSSASSVAKACGPGGGAFPPVPSGALTLGCATTAPVIDGSFADWAGVPEGQLATQVFPAPPTTAPDDLQATWQGQWDSRFLYLHLSVDDANRRPVDAAKPTEFWKGDGVNFKFGPDVTTLPASTKPRSGKDYHVMVGVTPLGGLASFNMANAGGIRDGGRLTNVVLSRTDRPGGYEVEMAVPWSDVGLVDPPARGSIWAMNVNVSDAAELHDVEARPDDQHQPGAHRQRPARPLAAPRPRRLGGLLTSRKGALRWAAATLTSTSRSSAPSRRMPSASSRRPPAPRRRPS